MKKMCSKCHEEKLLDDFVKDKAKKDGRRHVCKSCENLKRRKTPIKPIPKEGFKFCASCNVEKPLDEFSVRFIWKKHRPFSYCKPCEQEKDNNRYKHDCKMCGKSYNSGKKDTTYCKDCHDQHFIKTYSILHKLDWSGENNPMFGVQRYGADNPHYKPHISPEEREKGRLYEGYGVWRKQVYERDNYTCQKCGSQKGGTLHAHHLDGYNWCKEKRTDVDNGVTLCETCHNNFHSIYGRGYNSKEQFQTYMKNEECLS